MPYSSPQPSRAFDEGVRLVSFCPLCEASYNPREARILEEEKDGHLLHIECGNCHNAIIALVVVSTAGVSSVGLVTDLGYREVGAFRDAPAISTDDVIDAHDILQNESLLFGRLGALV